MGRGAELFATPQPDNRHSGPATGPERPMPVSVLDAQRTTGRTTFFTNDWLHLDDPTVEGVLESRATIA